MTTQMVPIDQAMVPLPVLATRINDKHTLCEQAAHSALGHAVEAGRLLMQAKRQVEHGEWQAWLEGNCAFSSRTAQAYMRVARHVVELEGKAQRAAHLSLREGLALLAEHKEPEPSVIVEGGVAYSPNGGVTYTPPDGQTYIPPPGCSLMLSDGEETQLWIAPSALHEGFYYVTRLDFDEHGGCVVDGSPRPIRADFVAFAVDQLCPFRARKTPATIPSGSWPSNIYLDGHQEPWKRKLRAGQAGGGS